MGSPRVLASGGVGAFVFKSQGSGKERKSWAVPEGEAGPAEKGGSGGGGWGAGGAVCIHQISQNLDRSQTWALGTQLCPPWPWAPGQSSWYLSDAGNGGAAESPTCLENRHFSSNGGLKT